MHVKRFLEWIDFKEKLHSIIHKPPFVSEREMWWASLGENVGAEINKQKGIEMSACLHQVRSIDYKRLLSYIGQLDDPDFNRMKEGFLKLCQ